MNLLQFTERGSLFHISLSFKCSYNKKKWCSYLTDYGAGLYIDFIQILC